MKRNYSIAFRENRAGMGGPGGVNRLLASLDIRGLQTVFDTRPSWISRGIDRACRELTGAEGELVIRHRLRRNAAFARKLPSSAGCLIFQEPFTHYFYSQQNRRTKSRVNKIVCCYHHQGSLARERLTTTGLLASPALSARLQEIEEAMIEHADEVIFPSRGAIAAFLECTTAANAAELEGKVRVIYNTTIPYAEVERKTLPSDPIRIVSVSTLSDAKGVDQIPQFIADTFLKTGRRVHYTLIGRGPLADEVLADLRSCGIDHQYHPRMPHAQIAEVLAGCHYYLMLHRISIFDLATLEAMAYGCVPVLSGVGGNLEFEVNENVLFADGLLADPSLAAADWAEKSRRNCIAFQDHFSPDVFRRQYENLLTDAAPEHAADDARRDTIVRTLMGNH